MDWARLLQSGAKVIIFEVVEENILVKGTEIFWSLCLLDAVTV